jgi:hypothetical protein
MATNLGGRGLMINDQNNQFSYVKEDDWRGLPKYTVPADGPIFDLVQLGQTFGRIVGTVFVDLDKVPNVPPPVGQHPGVPTTLPPLNGDNIVLKEADALYVVPQTAWTPADVRIAPGAMVAIDRGDAVINIPPGTIPCGTFCVLINAKVI